MPINVRNEHWYLAVVKIGENGVELNILNNIDMKNRDAEEKLMNVARKYHQRMIAQRNLAHAGTNENMPTRTSLMKQDATTKVNNKINRRLNFTPKMEKNTNVEICHDEKSNPNNHKHTDEMDKLDLGTPNQMNHKQSVDRETSEYIQFSQSREEHLHRTRQLKKNKSLCKVKSLEI